MNKPQSTPTKDGGKAQQARHQMEEVLARTRGTMARQELLKRLWQLGTQQTRKADRPSHGS